MLQRCPEKSNKKQEGLRKCRTNSSLPQKNFLESKIWDEAGEQCSSAGGLRSDAA